MKNLMLIIATSSLLMFSGSVLAFCVYNNLDTTARVSCAAYPFELLGTTEHCEGIEVSPASHVCVNYRDIYSGGKALVTVVVPDLHYRCEKSVSRAGGDMQLYYEKFLWIFNGDIICEAN